MACFCSASCTITLSDDGTVHSFGRNHKGALGLGHGNDVSIPTPIPNLPKINMVSCGMLILQFVWIMKVLFGDLVKMNMGPTRNRKQNKFQCSPKNYSRFLQLFLFLVDQEHTLMITNDDNLWSCGRNDFGQLCHGDAEDRLKPQKTSFSYTSKISTGYLHSLFQNNKGEIFSCGNNQQGQCGLGHCKSPQITPSLIPNVPSNIVHFVCGSGQNLFLDAEGNVFSVGYNYYGELGHMVTNTKQNVLNKIPNIPPIKIISCVFSSCYLIDFEGNLWTFGNNTCGQLGDGSKSSKDIPEIINTLERYSTNFLWMLWVTIFSPKTLKIKYLPLDITAYGQLGTGDTQSVLIPKEINSQYSTIWRDEFHTRAKSARK